MNALAPEEYVSPTYLLTTVRAFLDSITYRMLADGLELQDVRAAERLTDWADWGPHWNARARMHEALGRAALAKSYRLTAGEHLVRGALAAHYGQFLYFDFPEVKREGADLKVRLYRDAAPLLRPPAEPVAIPFRGDTLPGYLRVPEGQGPHPVVILLGGLDATKEDSHQFANLCLARNLGTLAFDGPGQGESLYRGHFLDPRFHEAISAAVDQLLERPDVKRDGVGILGRSLGGFFAPQAAALDDRIRACVAWGALYDLGSFDRKPPLMREGYRFVTGASDWNDAKERTSFISLAPFASKIRCPLYIVHGLADNSVPRDNAERLAREAQGPVKLWLVPDSIHCNHDVANQVRPDMADWLAEQLR